MRVTWEDAIARGWVAAADRPAVGALRLAARGHAAHTEREGSEQAELVGRFAARHPAEAECLIHIPNGGSRRHRFEGWRLKRQGVKKGVSDLFLAWPVGRTHGLWIEFKAAPPHSAAVTREQREWVALMRARGYAAGVCRGADDALATLERYLHGRLVGWNAL